MFKIYQNNNTRYAEVHQVNPLRWKTLYKQDDGTFVDQSGWVKCKDFYNDTVAFFKAGTEFSVYGYRNKIKKNNEGVYFLLKFIKDKPSFLDNLYKVVNAQLFSDLKCQIGIWDQGEDEVVVMIPNELWESTYRISMITYVIRLCNYGINYSCWDDLWSTNSPSHQLDHAFTKTAITNAKKYGFKVPEQFNKYWFFAGKAYNSEQTPTITGHVIHNNGVSNWSEFMEQEEV